ncbi:MAG: response regulator [Magnetococcus sp. WYHC-3]
MQFLMESSLAGSGQGLPSVLVIDDDPVAISMIDATLKADHLVRVALNGERGLNMALASPPDLILLDLVMPAMDGYEVCQHLKNDARTRSLPVIFLTGRRDEISEVRALEMGAADFLSKPIHPRLLRLRVNTHLAISNQQRQLEDKVRERTREIQELQLSIIQRLGRASEFRDNETGLHVIRMSHYCRLLAEARGLPMEQIHLLFHAAPMHDVGKIGVPDRVLLKPGGLSDDEFDIIRLHPTIGAEILGQDHSPLMQMAREVALTHHEHWNGRGYPRGLQGTDIPESGRIVAIADVFDALMSRRPYKQAWNLEQSLELIRQERGEQFDPRLVDLFLEIMPRILEIRSMYAEAGSE